MCIAELALLPSPQVAAIDAIVGAPLAWSSTTALDAAGHCLCVLEALEVTSDRPRGLLQRWELPEGTHWTLSPLGAHLRGVVLSQPNGVTRWQGMGGPAPSRKRPKGWNPWAWKPPKPKPRREHLIDEVSEMEFRLFGARPTEPSKRPLRGGIGNDEDPRGGIPIEIDPRLARGGRSKQVG